MFSLYSKGCEYAIRGLLHFPPSGKRIAFRHICRKARIPEHFARKMFQTLVREGILEAVTGPQGGYRLRRPPDRITLLDVIVAIDGANALQSCVLGLARCRDSHPCALHNTWRDTKEKLLPGLQTMTLAGLFNEGLRTVGARRKGGSYVSSNV